MSYEYEVGAEKEDLGGIIDNHDGLHSKAGREVGEVKIA